MSSRDGLNIAFELWIECLSVVMHQHGYYELLFVGRGSCRHMYNGTETLLIQGDAVIVTEHQPHGFSLHGETVIYNCQFQLDALEAKVAEELRAGEPFLHVPDLSLHEDVRTWQDRLNERERFYQDSQLHVGYELNNSKQGVIHLSPMEFSFVNLVLQHGIEEQENPDGLGVLMKQKYLEVILLELKKAMARQNEKYHVCSKSNQKAIAEVLMYMEEHLDEALDFNEVAQNYCFSPNHFRKIFKEITGLSPVSYLNRLRILRACEYMQKDKMTIREAAEQVGIYDFNYFSRLFKKIMGCSPSRI